MKLNIKTIINLTGYLFLAVGIINGINGLINKNDEICLLALLILWAAQQQLNT